MRSKGTRKGARKGARKGTRKVNKRGGGWFKRLFNRNRPPSGNFYLPSGSQTRQNERVAAAKRQNRIRNAYNISKRREKTCISDCTQRCKEDHRGRIASSYTYSGV